MQKNINWWYILDGAQRQAWGNKDNSQANNLPSMVKDVSSEETMSKTKEEERYKV